MWNLRWCRRSVRRSNNKELQLGDILESTMKWTHWTYLYTSWWHLMRYCRRRNIVLTTTATFYTPQHHPRLVLSRQRSKRSILFKQNPGINQWRGSRHISYIWVFQKHEISIWYPTSIWRFRENNVVSLPYQQQQQVAPRAPILIRQFVIVEDFYIDLPPSWRSKPRLHLSHDDVTESLKDTTYGQQLLIQLLIHEEVTSHKTIAIKYVHSDENYADMMTKCLAAPKTSKGFNGTCLKSLGKEWRSYRKTVHMVLYSLFPIL